MIKTNKVTNCAVYIDGESFIGQAEEITCPEVAPKMIDHKALGSIGETELPSTSIAKMSSKIKWNAPYLGAMKKMHDPFTAIRLQVRANMDVFEGSTRSGQIPVIIKMTGTPKKAGGLGFKPHDNVEREDELNVTAYTLIIDGEEIIHVDVLNNIWRVNGVDMLSAYRANIGQS